jgi:hypothetical protein
MAMVLQKSIRVVKLFDRVARHAQQLAQIAAQLMVVVDQENMASGGLVGSQ